MQRVCRAPIWIYGCISEEMLACPNSFIKILCTSPNTFFCHHSFIRIPEYNPPREYSFNFRRLTLAVYHSNRLCLQMFNQASKVHVARRLTAAVTALVLPAASLVLDQTV